MKFISFFSGIGGFEYGLMQAGHECLASCEIDDRARAVLARHFDHEIHTDITKFDGKPFRGRADLVCAGWPCQDLSVAGLRGGIHAKRSGLYWELLCRVREIKPRVCLFENVPGLLSSNGGRDMAAALRGLRECGYVGAYRILDSRWFGVPQRRRRVFLLAVRDTGDGHAAREAAEILALGESLCGHQAPSRKQGEGASRETAEGSGCGDRAGSIGFDSVGSANQQAYEEEIGPTRGQAGGGGAVAFDAAQITSPHHRIVGTLNASGAGTSRPAGQANEPDFCIPIHAHAIGRGDKSGPEGRDHLDDGDPSYTLDGRGVSPAIAAQIVRRLTPEECELLQGFPVGWTAGQADGQRYKQCGNAVTTNVVAWVGRRIREVIG